MIKEIFSKLFTRIQEPLFIIFILGSLCVWYVNRLHQTYQEDIDIPLYINGIDNPEHSGGTQAFNVSCRVKCSGYKLLQIKMFPQFSLVTINISQIISSNEKQKRSYFLDPALLELAIANNLENMELVKVNNSNVSMQNIPFASKRVRVYSAINFDSDNDYMELGTVQFKPKFVTIMGDSSYISKIDSIATTTKNVSVGYENIFSHIDIAKDPRLTIKPQNVAYNIKVARFTEQKITKNITIRLPENSPYRVEDFVMIPDKISAVVNVPISDFNELNLEKTKFYVKLDYDKNGGSYIADNKFTVSVEGLPKSCHLQFTKPSYVTVLMKK